MDDKTLQNAERVKKLMTDLYWIRQKREYFAEGKASAIFAMYPERENIGNGKTMELEGPLRGEIISLVLVSLDIEIEKIKQEVSELMNEI